MDAFIAGAWRSPGRGEIQIGGQWRSLTYGEAYLDGDWRRIVAFIEPLTIKASDLYGFLRTTSRRPVRVSTDSSDATPQGGLGPYAYSWALLSGTATINSPAAANTTFSATIAPYTESVSTARVTCTDSLGAVATADITITLSAEGND